MCITFSEKEISMYEQLDTELQLRENEIEALFYAI